MGRFIIVRHGESSDNRLRRFSASPHVGLSELGRAQALFAARRIASLFRPRLVITSPYTRAKETADIIAGELAIEIEEEPGFREQDLGTLAGELYEVRDRDKSYDPDQPWLWRPAGGETRVEVLRRVGVALDRFRTNHPDHELIVVSHGWAIEAMWAHAVGAWNGRHILRNGDIAIIEHLVGKYASPRLLVS